MMHDPSKCEWRMSRDGCGFYSERNERRVHCADIMRRNHCPFQDDEPPPIPEPEPFMTPGEIEDAKRAFAPRTPEPLPFVIVIDTREQTPLAFPDGVRTVRGTLHTGDYSIQGCESEFTVERKSLADAVHTVIHDRERFGRELERMAAFDFRRIIVTAPYSFVARGRYRHSRANPKSVIGLLRALEIEHDVPVVFADSATDAARFIVDWARFYIRKRAKHAELAQPGTPPVRVLGSIPAPRRPIGRGAQLSAIPPTVAKGCQRVQGDFEQGCLMLPKTDKRKGTKNAVEQRKRPCPPRQKDGKGK